MPTQGHEQTKASLLNQKRGRLRVDCWRLLGAGGGNGRASWAWVVAGP